MRRIDEVAQILHQIKEDSDQPKVVIFNAALHEIGRYCTNHPWRVSVNISNDDIGNCGDFYQHNFKMLLDLVESTFSSDLKIFRTTQAAWPRWGNFGFAWPAGNFQLTGLSPHVAKMFNDIALELIRQSGYDVKVYDLFWMTLSRPDDTEIMESNEIKKHMVHVGHDTLKASLRKMMTMVAEYYGCFSTLMTLS